MAYAAQLTRAQVVAVMDQDYVRTARALGVPEARVRRRHVLRNALLAALTYFGPLLATLLTGSFVVEGIYAIPGMGRFFVTAVTNRDYPLVLGVTLVYGALIVLAPVLLVVGLVRGVGMSTFPRYVDDPGTYLSQPWSLQYEGALSPYSYFYDHAPAGWIQIGLWSMLTDGFDRHDSAIGLGNECMLIAALASTDIAPAATAIVFTLTGNIVGVFFVMPVAIIAWFVFLRPTHQRRYREAIADLPRWDLRADGP